MTTNLGIAVGSLGVELGDAWNFGTEIFVPPTAAEIDKLEREIEEAERESTVFGDALETRELSACSCSSACGSNYNRDGSCSCSSACGSNYSQTGGCSCSSNCGSNYSHG